MPIGVLCLFLNGLYKVETVLQEAKVTRKNLTESHRTRILKTKKHRLTPVSLVILHSALIFTLVGCGTNESETPEGSKTSLGNKSAKNSSISAQVPAANNPLSVAKSLLAFSNHADGHVLNAGSLGHVLDFGLRSEEWGQFEENFRTSRWQNSIQKSLDVKDFLGIEKSSFGKALSWQKTQKDRFSEFTLFWQQKQVFGVQLKSFGDFENRSWVSGDLPSWWDQTQNPDFIPKVLGRGYSSAQSLHHMKEALLLGNVTVTNSREGFVISREGLIPADSFIVAAGGPDNQGGPPVPLEVFMNGADGSVIKVRQLAFDVVGKAVLFKENAKASEAQGQVKTDIPELDGTGSVLSTGAFKVLSCEKKFPSSNCAALAKGPDFSAIAYDSPQYDEVVAYYSVNQAISWHKSIMNSYGGELSKTGVNWGDQKEVLGITKSKQLIAYVRALTATTDGGTTLDNAQYLPNGRSGIGNPEIIVGTGWEQDQGPMRALLYLGRDADVTMHEFGHHIIFRTLRETSGQSGAMHEGFADYFTYAQTGNPFLGESIVAQGASLRRGTVVGEVKNFLRSSAHRAGEFWSSVLWELRGELGVWKDGIYKSDKIVWDSIDFLKENAKYYDAIDAMVQSANNFATQTGADPVGLKESMYRVFYKRGFLESPKGDGTLPGPSEALLTAKETPLAQEQAGNNAEVTKKKSKFSLCGTLAVKGESSVKGLATWMSSLLLMLPMLVLLVVTKFGKKQSKT